MTVPRVHVHTSRFGLRFGDMDALRHVNNTAYFTLHGAGADRVADAHVARRLRAGRRAGHRECELQFPHSARLPDGRRGAHVPRHARPLEHRQLLRDRGRRDDVRGRRGQDRVGRSLHGQVDAAARAHRRAAARAREGRRHDEQALGTVAGANRAREHHGIRRRDRRAEHGVDVGDYAKLWRWSVDHKEDFWRAMWDYGGVIGTPRRARAGRRAIACRARAGFRMRASTSRRTCSSAGAPTTTAMHSCSGARTRVKRRLSHARAARARIAHSQPRSPRTASCAGDRDRCLHAEHARDDHRDARRDVARRDLVVVLARLRRARAWSTASARSSRACCSRSTVTTTTARSYRSSTRSRDIVARLPSVERVVVVPYLRAGRGHAAEVRNAVAWDAWLAPFLAGPDRVRSSCRSTIRSTSSTRRARRACPSASCTAPAERCCST